MTNFDLLKNKPPREAANMIANFMDALCQHRNLHPFANKDDIEMWLTLEIKPPKEKNNRQ